MEINQGQTDQEKIQYAARWVREAPAILITAGAGMGVDSGLPDFRGPQGWWTTFPKFARMNMNFYTLASPRAFDLHPKLAWEFYAIRLNEYRKVVPHQGFHILRRWGEQAPKGCRVFTSNVDGEFQKAGFDPSKVLECHGSLHHLQCATPCCDDIWSADVFQPEFDPQDGSLQTALPTCPHCGGLARPHVLLFNDNAWIDEPAELGRALLRGWADFYRRQLLVIELGAGKVIPTVRRLGERHAHRFIRINTNEAGVMTKHGWMGIAGGALDILTRIDEELKQICEHSQNPN